MEQRRYPGNSHWYHETQSSLCAEQIPSQVPEAAEIEDRFLLGLQQQAGDVLKPVLQRYQHTALQAARDLYALFFPNNLKTSLTQTLTLYDRLSTALTVAQSAGVQRLCDHYAARLNPLPGPDSSRESNNRLTEITQYARQLSCQPSLIDAAAVYSLDEVGLTTPDIVTFSQIIGYVSYQSRIVAGIQALIGLPNRVIPGLTVPPDAPGEQFVAAPEWQPQLPQLELRYASSAQLDALASCQSLRTLQPAAGLLAHDASTLSGWVSLLATLDNPPPGEHHALAAAVSARINGSASCFYHYDGEFSQALSRSINDALEKTGQDSPEHAVIQLAAALTRSPTQFSTHHLQPLQEHGFSQLALLRLIQHVALANWSNRIMQTLGTRVIKPRA